MSETLLRRYIRSVLVENKWAGKSGADILHMLESYGNHTWVFFDTETSGMHPKNDQITEIAGIAMNPNGWDGAPTAAGQFNEKVTLTQQTLDRLNDPDSPERQRWEKENQRSWRPLKEPQDLLRMTRYGEKGRQYVTEAECIEGFIDFLQDKGNVVMCAQNAAFDMRMLSGRAKMYGLTMPRFPVIDTMKLLQLHLMPLMRTLKTELEDPAAAEFLEKTKTKGQRGGFYYSSSLGKVADAFNISIDEWHNAYADVKMMMKVLDEVVALLQVHAEVDYSGRHEREVAYQRRRNRR